MATREFHKVSGMTSSLIRVLRSSFIWFNQCVQSSLLYRGSMAFFMVTEAFAFVGFVAFWYRAASVSQNPSGYSPSALILYFIFASYHHGFQHHGASREVAGDIRMGKLSYALIRPFPYLLQAGIRSIAFSLTYGVLLFPIILGTLVAVPGLLKTFQMHANEQIMIQYGIALGLCLVMGWLTRIAIGLLAFDMTQIWGPDTFLVALYYAASGIAYPVDLLPSNILEIVTWTPLYYMIGFPVLTILGRINSHEFFILLGKGSLILFILALTIVILWRRGLRRFDGVGI